MSNTINLVTKFQPLLDEVYKAASLTGDLENGAVKFDGSKTVKVLNLTVPALGAYTRNTGYTAGDVTADWEPFTLTQDRGTEFSVDAMDNEETLNMTFGNASSEFIRRSVVPQVDAYRFAKMVQENGITRKQATLTTGDEVIAAINAISSVASSCITSMMSSTVIMPTMRFSVSTTGIAERSYLLMVCATASSSSVVSQLITSVSIILPMTVS